MQRMFKTLAVAAVAALLPAYASAGETEDRAAAQEIATMLRDSGQMQDYNVGVKYKNGTVWLNGRVTDGEQLQTALKLVSDAPGVEQIVNNMAVAPGKNAAQQQPVASRARQAGSQMAQPIPAAASGRANLASATTMPRTPQRGTPRPMARTTASPAGYTQLDRGPAGPVAMAPAGAGRPIPAYAPVPGGVAPAAYDQPNMPNCAWPSYAAYPNYAAVTYPKQYSASAWPFIGPFYPYPQVPLGWRKVSLEWDDGWWFLDFDDRGCH
jgi:hypothetical protein